MEIDPGKEEDLQNPASPQPPLTSTSKSTLEGESESVPERELSQTGSSEVAPDPPSVEEEKDKATMGDPEIPCSESAPDDVNPSETNAEGSDPATDTVEGAVGGVGVTESEADDDPGGQRQVEGHVAGAAALSWGDEVEEDQKERERYIPPKKGLKLTSIQEEPYPKSSMVSAIPGCSYGSSSNNKNKPPIVISDRDDNSTEEDENIPPGHAYGGNGVNKKGGGDEGACGGGGPKIIRSTKVVLRMLPPKMSKKEFLDSVAPLPPYDYVQVDNPDPEWKGAKSVAHINFLDPDDALWFIERFTGYQFFDTKGTSYLGIGDFAMSQKVFHPLPNKPAVNPERGKLLENEEWVEFLKKYELDPFAFKTGLPLKEVQTMEQMVTEIESRPKRKGPEATPLTEYILNKKSKRDGERQRRRERDRERQIMDKQRRDKDRDVDRDRGGGGDRDRGGGGGDRDYREHKKERKRDRRDKERKERREREKLEKEAKAKGMSVTYSKTGKVTRWSANSGPFTKKMEDEKEETDHPPPSTDKNKPTTSKLFDTKFPPSWRPDEKQPPKSDEFEFKKPLPKSDQSGFGKKKPLLNNPFSKDARRNERPRDDKPKFGKPFPLKSEQTSESSSSASKPLATTDKAKVDNRKSFDNKSAPTSDNKPRREEPPKNSSNSYVSVVSGSAETVATDPQGQAPTQSKKKIVKKIIRVRKVKSKEVVEGGGTSSGDSKPNTSKNVVQSSSSVNVKDSNNASTLKSDNGQEVAKDLNAAPPSDPNRDEKRRRARPDQQIYRPGSMRSSANSGNGGNGGGRPSQPQRNRNSGGGGGTGNGRRGGGNGNGNGGQHNSNSGNPSKNGNGNGGQHNSNSGNPSKNGNGTSATPKTGTASASDSATTSSETAKK